MYGASGKTVAAWKVISKQTGQVLKVVKGGTSVVGTYASYLSIPLDLAAVGNGQISVERGVYRMSGTSFAAYIGSTTGSTGWGLGLAGAVWLGEQAYDYFNNVVVPAFSDGLRTSGQSIGVPFGR